MIDSFSSMGRWRQNLDSYQKKVFLNFGNRINKFPYISPVVTIPSTRPAVRNIAPLWNRAPLSN